MMKVRILGNEADRLGFGLAGVPACTLEEADEETLLLVSPDAEVKETAAMVVRLPVGGWQLAVGGGENQSNRPSPANHQPPTANRTAVGGSENRPDFFSPANRQPPTANRTE